MNSNKKWFLAVGLATVITANGLAMAATTTSETEVSNSKQPAFADKGDFGKKVGVRQFKGGNTELLALLKLDEAAFKAKCKEGKTIAAIASEQGVSEQTLKDFMVKQMLQRIEEGVKAGHIPADRAEQMKTDIETRVTDMIQGKRPMQEYKRMGKPMQEHRKMDNSALLALLKIDKETFKTEMKAGKSLVTIAKEHGVTEQTLKDFMVEQMIKRIEEGVKAGRISDEQAAKMKADVETRVTDMINGKGPQHGHHRAPTE